MTDDPAGDLSATRTALARAQREAQQAAAELAERYEEINLLYSIGEILGRTVRLDDAARTILREIGDTVGARRGAIFVHDAEAGLLRPVATLGEGGPAPSPIPIDDDASVVARVHRAAHPQLLPRDASAAPLDEPLREDDLLAVPILWTSPEGNRPLGVITLSGRRGPAFTAGDQKLVVAIATQIGTAIQNARLVRASLDQERLTHELQLAHDLQMRLLPPADALGADATCAARVEPAEHVGGDFYQLFRLGEGRVGVLVGDVSSHGYQAALIMALAMSATAIHAQASADPVQTVGALWRSLTDELRATEMFVTLCYAVIDPAARRLRYVNAGHPHAFVVRADGRAERLAATAPPLGLEATLPAGADVPWEADHDLLLLFTDGISDARDTQGAKLGEPSVLQVAAARRHEAPGRVVDGIFALVEGHMGPVPPRDDQAVVVVRTAAPAAGTATGLRG